MQYFFSCLVLFLFGHLISAVAVYLNHRFLLHGRLGRLPILKKLKRLHALHHAHAYDEVRNDYFEPAWVKAAFAVVLLGVCFISVSFSLGLLSFGLFYGYRHKSIHNTDLDSHFSIHHRHHHLVNPRCNYSGIYPSIDYIFGTAAKQQKE
jgi:sterol desaturase/sphingolipid hydroxylase (fatty acid hydroxylase superfamily)